MNLSMALALVYEQLSAVAQSPDYWTILNTAFGDSYDRDLAIQLQRRWQGGDFGDLPPVEVLSQDVLGAARGAYAVENNTIYLADSFVVTASLESLSAVLLEEIGHYVDGLINTQDSPGDEGEIFAALALGVELSGLDLENLKAQSDQFTIWVAGEPVSAEAASFTVTNTNDSGAGSLRQAILDANASAGADTITFAGIFTDGTPDTIILTSGQLTITDSVTIQGPGTNLLTISGNNSSRVFLIDDGNDSNLATVALNALTITDGNAFEDSGGGILNRENLTLNNSTISGNSATEGGGIYNLGTAMINNSTLQGNFANFGGGVFNKFGSVEINNSTINGNSSWDGAGIYNQFGIATIGNSTISGNFAQSEGGGIANLFGTVTLDNSTISGNNAPSGGGIFNASQITLTSTIVANNGTNDLLRLSGTINASNSLIENNADQINGTSTNNITGVDPLLGPLQNNGGPTQTLALLPGSPAINAGSNPNNLTTDQRGATRSQGAGVDIGAVEFLSELVVDTLVDENDGNFSAGDLSLREALALIADGGTITFANSLAGGTITLTAGQLVINKSLTLDGDINGDNGADITISGNNSSRVFLIDDGNGSNLAQVELNALTITGGNISGFGGGILNRENLSLNNSTISGNFAFAAGGGIYNATVGTATIANSTISGNSAKFGGGIANAGTATNVGTATIANSTISGNSTTYGGGLFNSGTATIASSTISGNSATYSGGGIYNSGGTATVANSTLSGNSAGVSGGGIYNNDGTTSLTSAIVANNTASSGNDLRRLSGTINASNSLIENNADQINGTNTNNITGVDPLLGPLQNNGGPTQTFALLPGSPAINAGSNPNNLTTDQRGVARLQGAGVDIGAVEFLSELVVDTLVDENDGNFLAGDLSLREALALIADGGTITFANSLAGGTITLTAGQLVINKSLTLDGDINGDNGADITISGNNSSRVFLIDDGNGSNLAQVELSALTITGGNVSGNGGGIFNRENLRLTASTISGNSGSGGAGGILNYGTAEVSVSTISGNSVSSFGNGGGIFNLGTATVTNSTLSGNSVVFGSGGGISNYGTVVIANSTLSGNSSEYGGGGIFNRGTATVANSTLSGNSVNFSGSGGGGILNNSGTTSLTSAIVANNTASNGNDLQRFSGTINASNSLIENNADQINGTNTNNITGVDPLLGPLQDNGGPTQTLALLSGSPAINAGSNPNNLTTDQRGVARLQGAGVDIGAFEAVNEFLVTNTNDSGEGSLRQAIVNANATLGANTITFAIPGSGVQTINLLSALPEITEQVAIDGTSQPGYSGAPLIALNGTSAGSAVNGLTLASGSDGSQIKGLIINLFGGNGIVVQSSNNTIQENSIFNNGKLGIDLGNDGITDNDLGDGDVGANALQNSPRLSLAPNGMVAGSLNGAANTTFQVEFFSNSAPDPSGYGEGETFLGAISVTTDGDGHGSFSFDPGSATHITATATDPSGNTSEFSDVAVTQAPTFALLTDNFAAFYTPNTFNLDYNLLGRQGGALATTPWVPTGSAQVGKPTPNIDQGNYLLFGATGRAALDRNFNGASAQGGLKISFDLAPNAVGSTDQTLWGGINLGLSEANKSIFINENFPHFGILFRGNGAIQAFDGGANVSGVNNGWGGTGNNAALKPFSLELTDSTDGNPFDGVGETRIDVFANNVLIYSYVKGAGGYGDNYINLGSFGVAGFDNLRIEQLGRVPFAENGTGAVYTATAVGDPVRNPALVYSLDGPDKDLFNISATGEITFKTPPNFEAPTDAGADNVYNLTVIASDESLTGAQDVEITVTDVNEAPMVALDNEVITDTNNRVKVADIIVTDDALGTNNLNLSGADAAIFEIQGTGLFIKAGTVLDFETQNSFEVTVEVDDPALGSSFEDSVDFSLTLSDFNEFIVTNTNDSGVGSLRQAIITANLIAGANTITFAIPGSGVQTINLLSALPEITGEVAIDGTSQPGYSGAPLIELNGNGLSGNGLTLNSANNTIKGLTIKNFSGSSAQSIGIRVNSSGNLIENNIVFGNRFAGIALLNSSNVVKGNLVGTNATSASGIGNFIHGIYIQSSHNIIGGANPSEQNVVSGNGFSGIAIFANPATNASNNVIQGNYIGTDTAGTQPLGNGSGGGIRITGANNVIGGTGVGEGNIIANNAGNGVYVTDAFNANPSLNNAGNKISGNSIFNNTALGIDLATVQNGSEAGITPNDLLDLDAGVNNLQNSPRLSLAPNGMVAGSLNGAANTTFQVEFFSNSAPDPSGYGEGETFLGAIAVTTDDNGNGSFSFDPGSATNIAATATDPSGNTSEFSDVAVTQAPTFALLTDNFAAFYNRDTFNLDYNLLGRQGGTLATTPWVPTGSAQVGKPTPNIDQGNYLLLGATGRAALDRNFNGASAQGGLKISFDLAPNAAGSTNQTIWGGISLGLSEANKSIFINENFPHFGILFRGNGAIQAFDSAANVSGVNNGWGGTGNNGALKPFSLELTDSTDGNPFDGVGETRIDVFANNVLIYSYVKGAGGYGDNYINLVAFDIAGFDNLRIEQLGRVPFAENGTGAVYTATAVGDPVRNPTLVYSLDGPDKDLFNISATGEITFKTPPNFESPTDAGEDNVYNLTVIASDESLTGAQDVEITVTDVNEAPTVALDNEVATLPENANTTNRVKVADIVVTDDALGTNNLSLSGADATIFEIQGTGLFIKAGTVLDFETNPILDVTVKVDDPALGSTFEDSVDFSLTLDDLNELIVTNTNDSGLGSLRQAIITANVIAGANTITFAIPGSGVQTINLLSALPGITGEVAIDGTSQPGYSGAPLIALNGTSTGSAANGLTLASGSDGSQIRGLSINLFSGNGIVVQSSNNTIQENSIFNNGKLGIDLGNDGITDNDLGDGDVGANALQNSPRLSLAPNGMVAGSLNGAANTTFQVEFFSNSAPDPSGYGEGETFLGAIAVTTDGDGHGSFSFDPGSATHIAATATDPSGNTSEFSNVAVTHAPTFALLTDNFAAFYNPNTFNLDYNLLGRQGGTLATTPWVPTNNAQVGNPTANIDQGNYLLLGVSGRAALDRNFNGANAQGGLKISFDLALSVGSDSSNWGGINLGLSEANKSQSVNANVPHFGVLFRGNGGLQSFNGSSVVSGANSVWGGGFTPNTLLPFSLELTDPTDGNPFDGVGQTTIEVFAGNNLVFSYIKNNGGYSDNYINLDRFGANASFDNLRIEQLGRVPFAENGTGAVYTATAVGDPVRNPALVYSLDGPDKGLFNISATGEISFKAPPNFEAPTDAGADNVYNLTVIASDESLTGAQDVEITVTDVNEAPTVALDNEVATLLENTNTTNRVKVADIVVTDDALGTNNLSLSGADAAIFEIQGTGLFIKAGTVLDFETKASYNVTVEVDDPTIGATPDAAAPFTLTLTDVNETISILNGPSNHPNATGANGSNDDFTNKSSLVPAGLNPGSTFDPSPVFFTNTVRNTGGQTINISLAPTAPSTSQNLPSGTSVTIFFNTLSATYFYNGSSFAFNGGSGFVGGNPISGNNPVRIDNVASNGTVNYGASIDLPDGTPLSTDLNIERGFPVPITAFVDSNANGVPDDSATNITINQVYTGFLQLLKESRVLQGAGPDVQGTEGIFSTAPKNPAPGNIVEYKISYENISEPNLGSGNITLTAGTVTITEDGLLGSNNWAEDNDSDGLIDTSHVLGSAQGAGTIFYFSGNPANNLLVGEQTGVTADSDIAKYVNNLVGSVAPGAGGTFIFQRQVNQTTAGTQIANTATATYEDPNNPNVPINGTSNSANVTVAEVAGITVTFDEVITDGAIAVNDLLIFKFIIANVGNDPTGFRIPNFASTNGPATVSGTLPNGGAPSSLQFSTDGGSTWQNITGPDVTAPNIPVGGQVLVRVPITVQPGAQEGDIISVKLGNTQGDAQNVLQIIVDGGDVFTVDNPDGSPGEVTGSPVNGIREASATGSLALINLNKAPTVALDKEVPTLPENADTTNPVKVADIIVTDDGLGTNNLSLSGADAALFEIQGTALFIKAGTILDFETNPVLDVTVEVDDPAVGMTPDDSAAFTLNLTNVIEGTPGKDRLSGTPNADIIDGLGGDDTLLGREQNDLIFGREGNDTVQGNDGNDTIFGGAGLDRLSGDNNDDQLFGEAGNDYLVGGNGNDLLVGGQGKDTLAGGAGADKFDYQKLTDSLLSGFDIITDFRANDDKFLVSNLPILFTPGAGKVSILNAARIGAILTPGVFANPGDAALFTNGARTTTYLGLNGATPGFQAGEDAILELRNFALAGTITGANFTLS